MIQFARYNSPFGPIQIGYEGEYIVSIRRCDEDFSSVPSLVSELANKQIQEYSNGTRMSFDFPFRPKGTPFQQAVWQALQTIPYGKVKTYGQIAAAIGRPKAARAVGLACNKNPIWIAIPCHRVVGSDGSLAGYAGGLALKKQLLELERRFE